MTYFPLKTGTATLIGGTIDVPDSMILAGSKVLISNEGTIGTIGILSVKITSGSSFAINSSVITDTSVINYMIIY